VDVVLLGSNTVWTCGQIPKLQTNILPWYLYKKKQGTTVSIVTGYGLDNLAIEVRSPAEIFPLNSVFRPALGYTQSPIQWVPGILSQGLKHG
jgi:hypothetical protein